MAWLALCVLGLGLPQLLIVCRGDDGSVQLEFAHGPHDCCHEDEGLVGHAQSRDDRHTDHGDAEHQERAPDCEHEELAVGPTPMPKVVAFAVPPAVLAAVLPVPPRVPHSASRPRAELPPATGPPGQTAHLRRLSATRLLL